MDGNSSSVLWIPPPPGMEIVVFDVCRCCMAVLASASSSSTAAAGGGVTLKSLMSLHSSSTSNATSAPFRPLDWYGTTVLHILLLYKGAGTDECDLRPWDTQCSQMCKDDPTLRHTHTRARMGADYLMLPPVRQPVPGPSEGAMHNHAGIHEIINHQDAKTLVECVWSVPVMCWDGEMLRC